MAYLAGRPRGVDLGMSLSFTAQDPIAFKSQGAILLIGAHLQNVFHDEASANSQTPLILLIVMPCPPWSQRYPLRLHMGSLGGAGTAAGHEPPIARSFGNGIL